MRNDASRIFIYLFQRRDTTSSTEKDIGAENPEATTVPGFFHADF